MGSQSPNAGSIFAGAQKSPFEMEMENHGKQKKTSDQSVIEDMLNLGSGPKGQKPRSFNTITKGQPPQQKPAVVVSEPIRSDNPVPSSSVLPPPNITVLCQHDTTCHCLQFSEAISATTALVKQMLAEVRSLQTSISQIASEVAILKESSARLQSQSTPSVVMTRRINDA